MIKRTTFVKKVFLVLAACFMLIGSAQFANAQSETDNKKKIIVIKKTIDENGVEKIERIVKEGTIDDLKAIEKLMKEGIVDENVHIDIDVEIESEEGETEDLFIFREAGSGNEEEITIEKENGKIFLNGEEIKEGSFEEEIIEEDGKRIIIKRSVDGDFEEVLEEMDIDLDEVINQSIEINDNGHTIIKKRVRSTGGGFLGVYVRDGKGDMTEVESIIEGSPAEKAGLKPGDKIISINGAPVKGYAGLVKTLGEYKPGQDVQIQYLRNTRNFSVNVLLAKRPNEVDEDVVNHFNWTDDKQQKYNGECKITFLGECNQTDKPRLGVTIEDDNQGVLVIQVLDESPAQKGGILKNDVIVKFHNDDVKNTDELIKAVGQKKIGDNVNVSILRNGEKLTIATTLDKTQMRLGKSGSCGSSNKKVIKKKKIIILKDREDEDIVEESIQPRAEVNNTLELNDLEMYPNPTDGIINVRFSTITNDPVEIIVNGANGAIVYKEKNDATNGSYQGAIDLSRSPDGIYILNIIQNGKLLSEKIVLSRD